MAAGGYQPRRAYPICILPWGIYLCILFISLTILKIVVIVFAIVFVIVVIFAFAILFVVILLLFSLIEVIFENILSLK